MIGWIIYLQWQFVRLKNTYRAFFSDSNGPSLKRELQKYAHEVSDAQDKLNQLAGFVTKLHKKSLQAITKVGMVRFNPFGDTGGDQSFCLVLLDSHNNGLSISSIHARTGTRFYAKQIVEGKSTHALSDEEQAAYQQAISESKST